MPVTCTGRSAISLLLPHLYRMDPSLLAKSDASRRTGSSRTIGPVKQCAVYVRGGRRCVWCFKHFAKREDASIDHLDGNHRNNLPSNLVPACPGCNSARYGDWPTEATTLREILDYDWFSFEAYLSKRNARLDDALARVLYQIRQPLPYIEGERLAWLWHEKRMTFLEARKVKN